VVPRLYADQAMVRGRSEAAAETAQRIRASAQLISCAVRYAGTGSLALENKRGIQLKGMGLILGERC
jgi:hypothetical protein